LFLLNEVGVTTRVNGIVAAGAAGFSRGRGVAHIRSQVGKQIITFTVELIPPQWQKPVNVHCSIVLMISSFG
jgi:hypothetical protein